MKLPHAYLERLLRGWPVARLVTLRPDGRLHAVPIVFVWHDRSVWSAVDGKPKQDAKLQRLRNLHHDPRATVLVDRYGADWSRLWWVRLEGKAEILSTRDPDGDSVLREPIALLRAKYPQYRRLPLFRGEPTLIRVMIENRRSWCASEAVLQDLRQI